MIYFIKYYKYKIWENKQETLNKRIDHLKENLKEKGKSLRLPKNLSLFKSQKSL